MKCKKTYNQFQHILVIKTIKCIIISEKNKQLKRIMKLSILLSVICLIITFPPVTYGEGKKLNIIYTGSLEGELEPCGCSPKGNFGGLARLSGYIGEHDKRAVSLHSY